MGQQSSRHSFLLLFLLASLSSADDSIQVVATSSRQAETGLLGCLQPSSYKLRVRFQAMKTLSGLAFYRKTLDQGQLACYEAGGFEILPASNIVDCAEATEAAGLVMFRWDYSVCTAYSAGIPKDTACSTGGAMVVYSVDGAGSGPQQYKLELVHSISSIWAEWSECHPDISTNADKFELDWNNTTVALNGTTFEYRLKNIGLCETDLTAIDLSLLLVTLRALDDTDSPVMGDVTEYLSQTEMSINRYQLASGNCMIYSASGAFEFSFQKYLCEEMMYGTMFTEHQDGDLQQYRDDLVALRNGFPSVVVRSHYVGLQGKDGQWDWLGGLQQNVTDPDVWDESYPMSNDGIGFIHFANNDRYLLRHDTGDECVCFLACHEYAP